MIMASDARAELPGVPEVSPIPRVARIYQRRRAGIVSRLIANGVDFAVTLTVLGAGYVGVSVVLFLWSPSGFRFPRPAAAPLLAAGALVMFAYLTLSWATTGRTYGDHLLGLRVVNAHYQQPRLVAAALRAAFCVVCPVGLLYVAVSRTNRSLQDVVLRTAVIYDWGPARPGHGFDARLHDVPRRAAAASRDRGRAGRGSSGR